MRMLCVVALLLSGGLVQAKSPAPEAFEPVFALAGIALVCEQSEPLALRGLPAEQQALLGRALAAEVLCRDLATRLARILSVTQLEQARVALASPLAQRFTETERQVGEHAGAALADYRAHMSEHPPRAERLALVRRLDHAAQTTTLATLLRYEVGKTQVWLALRAGGERIDENALEARAASQRSALHSSSAEAVESFMLYAYRQMPSALLAEYAALYEQAEVSKLLTASVEALPAVFAARRASLK